MSEKPWSSIHWRAALSETKSDNPAWYTRNVPYISETNALQNIDVWVPSTSGEAPSPSSFSERQGIWIIYIHGGAWRDPLVDCTSFKSPVEHLLNDHSGTIDQIAGIASLNYTLSPHPRHPTHPAPPKDKDAPIDSSRQASHPDHIIDVLAGLSFLQHNAGFGNNYVLLGHSCGATLAFQVAMNHSRWGGDVAALKVAKPKTIVGLNGIYDLPSLIAAPGPTHENLKPIYRDFTQNAFGDDEKLWHDVSPISVEDWAAEWDEGVKAVLVQSKEDSLVPYCQTEEMLAKLKKSKSGALSVEELGGSGDHNYLWQEGARVAQIISIVMKSM